MNSENLKTQIELSLSMAVDMAAFVRTMYVDFDVQVELDFNYPTDAITWQMMQEFYRHQAALLTIERYEGDVDIAFLEHAREITDAAFTHIQAVLYAHRFHRLSFTDEAAESFVPGTPPHTPDRNPDEHSDLMDVEDSFFHDDPLEELLSIAEQSGLLYQESHQVAQVGYHTTSPFSPDLTQEGVPPNLGPARYSTLRCNRSSGVLIPSRAVAVAGRRLNNDALRKLAQRAAKQGREYIHLGDVSQAAQISGKSIEFKQAPPPECDKCGSKRCVCMVKRASLAAAVASIINSVLRIAETLLQAGETQMAQNGDHQQAQAGYKFLDRIIFGSGGATEAVKTAIEGAVNEVLDTELAGIHMSVRATLKVAFCVVCFYMLYRLGCIAYDVAMLLVSAFQDNRQVAQVANSWFTYGKDSAHEPADIMDMVHHYVPTAVAMVLSCLVAVCVGKLPGRDNTPESWMRKISMFPRAISAQCDIFSTIQTCIKPLWKKFEIEVLGHDATLLDDAIPQVTSWLAEIEYFSHRKNLDRVCEEKAGRYAVASLYALGNRLLINYQTALTPEYRGAIQRGLHTAAKLRTYIEDKFPDVKTVRNAPLAIWLVGESQIGKSRLQYLIALELCKAAGLTDLENEIYMRCAEQVFWDGALKQFVTILDDFGQQRDTAANPNIEFFELIRMIGPFPYPLHMADLSEKNCTRFASSVVMCSTNNRHLRIESLTYEDAVWNRLTQSWEVRVKPEYLKEVVRNGEVLTSLDLQKVRADLPGWEINPYIYEFVRFDARLRNEDDPYTGERFGWDDFIAELKRDLLERLQDGTRLNDWLRKHMKEGTPLPPRQEAQVGVQDIVEMFASTKGEADETLVKTKLAHFLKWLREITADPLGHDDALLTMYHHYAEFEAKESDTDPQDIQLCDYIPKIIPDDMWRLLIIAYFKHRESGSRTARTMAMCADIYAGAYERMPDLAKKIFAYVKGACSSIISGTWNFMKDYKFAIAGASLLAYLMTRKNGEGAVTTTRPAGAESDPRVLQPRSRPAARAAGRSRATKGGRNRAEMGQNLNQLDVIESMRRQQYLLLANYRDGTTRALGCCLQITGNVFMMPKHFFAYMEDNPPLTVSFTHTDSRNIVVTRNYQDMFVEFVTMETEDGHPMDVMFFVVERFMRGKDLTKHFVSDEDLIKLYDRKLSAMITGIDYSAEGNTFTRVGGPCTLPKKEIIPIELTAPAGDGSGRPRAINTYWAASLIRHTIPTKFGDCGKLISLNTTAVSPKFVGMHISGSASGDNYGQVVTSDTIRSALAQFDQTNQIPLDLPHVAESVTPTLPTGVLHKGHLTENVAQLCKTAIVPSKLHGKITKPTTRPALLKPKVINGVYHDPLIEGAKKVGVPCGIIPSDVLEMAVNDVKLCAATKNNSDVDVRVLTYEEAIQGIPNDELFQPINRTTSPGFPYVNHPKPLGKKGKTNWMGRFDYDFESDQAMQLRCDVENAIRRCREDEPIEVIWIDTLKDERRAHEKVDAGKTRIISNGPMHINIAFRMYFMAALAHLRAGRIYNGIAVGINVWSREWDALAQHLLNNSDAMIDGDFKEFDGTLMDQVMWEIFHVLDSLYNDGNTKVRRNLWYHAVYAVRSCRGIVYQTTHGLPSGFIATAEANSLYVNIIFRCVYLELARRHCVEEDSMGAFRRNVRLVAYGDDNITSIKRHILPWFNMNTVIEQMKVYGLTYTPADKSDNVVPFKGIEEISFLKRYFRRVPSVRGVTSVYMCPADLESRLEMLNWTKNTKSSSEVEEALVIGDVIKEIAMHGVEVYGEWVPRIIAAAKASGIDDFTEESCYYYHHKVIAGNGLPMVC